MCVCVCVCVLRLTYLDSYCSSSSSNGCSQQHAYKAREESDSVERIRLTSHASHLTPCSIPTLWFCRQRRRQWRASWSLTADASRLRCPAAGVQSPIRRQPARRRSRLRPRAAQPGLRTGVPVPWRATRLPLVARLNGNLGRFSRHRGRDPQLPTSCRCQVLVAASP